MPQEQDEQNLIWIFTRRESEIIAKIMLGLTNQQIAESLGISSRTVKHHLTNIFRKLGIASRTQLALWIALNAKSKHGF
jgi:DNA-binding NarL/FixJ family response regulator